jgi:hypothetical protein
MFRFAATWVLQCIGTLLLLVCMYWWLTWPDESAWQVVASALTAFLLLAGVACMECSIFAAGHNPSTGLRLPTCSAFGAFALWLMVFGIAELGLVSIDEGVESAAVRFAQMLHLPPRLTTRVLDWGVLAFIWLLLPALMLPLGSLLSNRGFAASRQKAMSNALHALRSRQYWVGLCLALAGIYGSSRLTQWIPERRTFRGELWSAALRLGAAYLLAATAIAFIAWNTAQVILSTDAETAMEKNFSTGS